MSKCISSPPNPKNPMSFPMTHEKSFFKYETRDQASPVQKMTALEAESNDRPRSNNGTPISGDHLTSVEIQKVRDDWKALGDAKKQRKIIEDMFKHVFVNYEHLRAIWAFGKKYMHSVNELDTNPAFYNHVTHVVGAITALVGYLHNQRSLLHLMHEVGTRHFFYEAIEPHYDVLQEAFLHSLQTNRPPDDVWTNSLSDAWRKAFITAKQGMQNGLKDARFQYLATSMTSQEMITVTSMWDKVKEHGLKEAGLSFCNAAVRSYEALVNDCFGPCTKSAVSQRLDSSIINKFAADAMMALNAAIQSYDPDIGFADLPNTLSPFTNEYFFTEASPVLVRRALMEGLMNMITYALGEVAMTECVQHTWMKLYRIVEQAVIISQSQARNWVECGPPHPNYPLGPYPKPRPNQGTHIQNGDTAGPHSFPWMVNLEHPLQRCGATLVPICKNLNRSDIIVTAAHCFKKADHQTKKIIESIYGWTAHFGVNGVDDLTGAEEMDLFSPSFKMNAAWDPLKYKYGRDLAVMKLPKPIKFTDKIMPICLPETPMDVPPPDSWKCFVAGWGVSNKYVTPPTRPNQLLQAKVDLYPPETCLDFLIKAGHYSNADNLEAKEVIKSGMCTRPQPNADGTREKWLGKGDSGGPLACFKDGPWKLFGVISTEIQHRQNTSLPIVDMIASVIDYENLNWLKELIAGMTKLGKFCTIV